MKDDSKAILDTKCFFSFVADVTGKEKINMKKIEATELFIVELVKKRIKEKKKENKKTKS